MDRERDEVTNTVAGELKSLGPDDALRLGEILRGLFSCVRELNQRVLELETRPPAVDFPGSD